LSDADISGQRQGILPLSIVLVLCWLAVVGVTVWIHAAAESEPPEWDVLSYAVKALNFWNAIGTGHLSGLLDLQPTVRPPGTVLMSYPFGFSNFYGGFYFRSIFVPLSLIVGAVYIASYSRHMSTISKWDLAFLAIAIGGMPMLFQFQGNDGIPFQVTWGLVDGFLAGAAAIAIAAAQRSVSRLSCWWAIASTLAAAFCLMIKPAGLLVMVLVSASWSLLICFRVQWDVLRLWRETELRRLCFTWLIGLTVIYGMTAAAAFRSEYLGAANMAWGAAALAVLQRDFAQSFDIVGPLIQSSLGYPAVLLIGVGLIAGLFSRQERGAGAAAALCLAAGIWFWIVATGLAQVRYFFPFGVMALILVVPSLLRILQRIPAPGRPIAITAMVAPTAFITYLLILPNPPVKWQKALGINLSTGVFRAENEQALSLLRSLQTEGVKSASFFFAGMSPAYRSFGSVFSYWTAVDATLPRITVRWPVNWQSETTFHLNEIGSMDYVAVVRPLREDAQLAAVLETKAVPDLGTEFTLMAAWFSTLGVDDGVEVLSETRVRALRIADRDRFHRSIERLRESHDWRPAFLAANPGP
jgi:hypothetical protein